MQFLVVPYPLLKSTVKVNICEEVPARVMQIYRSQGLLEMNIDAHFVLVLLIRIAHARNSYLKLLLSLPTENQASEVTIHQT